MKLKSIKLIIVEDSENDIDIITETLDEQKNVELLKIFKSGLGVCDYLGQIISKEENLVVFTDLNMPNFDGFELIREIRSNESLKQVPVYVLSSSQNKNDILESYKLGVNSYIQKNPDLATYEKKLNSTFDFLTHYCELV